MACTAAVETEIDRHYARQLDELGDSDPELSEAVARFREEELEHRDTALEHGICFAPGDVFSASRRFRNCLRLSAGSAWSERIEKGVRRLGELAQAQLSA